MGCVLVEKGVRGSVFWLSGQGGSVKWPRKECVKPTREEHVVTLQSRPGTGSLYYVFIHTSKKKKKRKKKKKKNPSQVTNNSGFN